LQEQVEGKVEDQIQTHQVEVQVVTTEMQVEIHLVLEVVVEHKLQVEMVERLGREHLLVVKQEHWVKVEMVDFGKQHQVVVEVVVVLVEVVVEMMVVVLVQMEVEVVVPDHLYYLLVGLVWRPTTQDTDILQ
jgi:hypothetical protein